MKKKGRVKHARRLKRAKGVAPPMPVAMSSDAVWYQRTIDVVAAPLISSDHTSSTRSSSQSIAAPSPHSTEWE